LKDKLSLGDQFHSFTIADYYIAKSIVFSKETLKKDEFILYSKLYNIIVASLPKPELLVYLHLDTKKLQQNIRKRGREYELNIKDEYLDKIQNSYFDYLRKQLQMRILIIDTNRIDFVNKPTDYQKIISILNQEYN